MIRKLNEGKKATIFVLKPKHVCIFHQPGCWFPGRERPEVPASLSKGRAPLGFEVFSGGFGSFRCSRDAAAAWQCCGTVHQVCVRELPGGQIMMEMVLGFKTEGREGGRALWNSPFILNSQKNL